MPNCSSQINNNNVDCIGSGEKDTQKKECRFTLLSLLLSSFLLESTQYLQVMLYRCKHCKQTNRTNLTMTMLQCSSLSFSTRLRQKGISLMTGPIPLRSGIKHLIKSPMLLQVSILPLLHLELNKWFQIVLFLLN